MSRKIRKDCRKELTGSKAVDPTCRNHGACSWCKNNRLFFDTKRRTVADEELKNYEGRSIVYKGGFKFTNAGVPPFTSCRDSEVAMLVSALRRKENINVN